MLQILIAFHLLIIESHHLLLGLCFGVNDLLSGFKNLNCWYPGYTTSWEFREWDEEEKSKNVSSVIC